MTEETTDLDALLVEDNPGDAKLVEHHLGSPSVAHFVEDVSLTHVESLAGATDAVADESYDVVLLDLGLHESSGLETLDRATGRVDDVPIIVLTGMDDRETAMEAIERGAQDYLPKGELDGDRLVRALRYAVVRSRQQRQLRQKNEQMEFFNGILRHDLLNGMNVIQSRGELLADQLEGTQAEYAETIVDWSENVTDLTRKVRSTLKTLTDGKTNELNPIRLEPILRAEVDRADQMAERVSFTVECDDEDRAMANELLGDVVGNLLTNAIEHTEGPVEVRVSVETDDERVRIAIDDDGPGVDRTDDESIFERGERGDGSSGSGFGLYFVGAMVDSYGGDVWVEASDRGGALFVVELDRPPGRLPESH
jgi:signal transduction histidine kinase